MSDMALTGEEAYALLINKIRNLQVTGGVITNYGELTGKPVINGITLVGNISLQDLGIEEMSNTKIDQIIKSIGGL